MKDLGLLLIKSKDACVQYFLSGSPFYRIAVKKLSNFLVAGGKHDISEIQSKPK